MLLEIPNVRQIAGEPRRRWFCDMMFDLIVWYRPDNSIEGFQLCYRLGAMEKALTWMAGNRFMHSTVDDGDTAMGGHKRTPILLADGAFDRDRILKLFRTETMGIDRDVVEFVTAKLSAYPCA